MTHTTGLGHGRRAAVVLTLALLASLVPLASAYAISPSVTAATGGSAISVDEFGTSNYTTLTGPTITENAAGLMALNSTTILHTPVGFQFNPAVGNLSVSGAGCDLVTSPLAMTTTTATFSIMTVSSVNTCVINYVGLQVQPTSGTLPSTGNLTKTGTSAAPSPGNYGTLTAAPGAVALVVIITQPSATTNGGTPFATQPSALARDQFSHNVPGVPMTLSITPGTGPAGATLTCLPTSNIQTTNGAGIATWVGCSIDKAGTYTLRATSNGKFADTGTLIITVGPASKLTFTSYPGATTPQLLTPQPAVAVTDLGGNVIVTDTRPITIAINQNGGTFSCTGGLTAVAVAGVATFSGCTQTTIATGYTLTATSAPALTSVTGPVFAVAAAKLAFVVQPSSTTSNTAFAPNIQVAIQDSTGTTQTGSSATIALTIGTNPSGGTLTCTGGNSAATVSGVATFTGCSINNPGAGYTLVATATVVPPALAPTAATSNPFNIGAPVPSGVISISASSSVILWGSGVTLSVHLSPLGGSRTVTIQAARDGVTFSTIATLTTDASGDATFNYRPANNNYYRAVFAGAADLGAVTSALTRVVVRQIALLRPTNSGHVKVLNRGNTITFTTTVRPTRSDLPQGHVTYEVYKKVGGSWSRVLTQVLAVNTSGLASLAVTFSSTGSYYVRSMANPTTFNANSSWSAPERYDVH